MMDGIDRLVLDRSENYSTSNTPQRNRHFNYYGSPYKKVPASQSSIGLPDWSHRNYSRKPSLMSNSWNSQLSKSPASRKRSLRFLEPDFLYFLDDQMESDLSNQSQDEEYFVRQTSYFSAENSYLGHEKVHIPEIQPLFENERKTVPSEYKTVALPDIYGHVKMSASENSSESNESGTIPKNRFASLKQIDKVFNRDYKPAISLPPIALNKVKKSDSSTNETDSETSDDKKDQKRPSKKKKKANGKVKIGNLNSKTKAKKVHFLKGGKENDTKIVKKVKPILPKIVGLRLTYQEITEREIPAIVTKYLLPLGNKSMAMSMEQLVAIFQPC